MYVCNYGLHGGGAVPAGGAGVGAGGDRVLRVQTFMQRVRHSWAIRTSHIGSRFRRVGATWMIILHPSEARVLHLGIQIARQSFCMSPITGGPIDNMQMTSMMHAWTAMTFLTTAPLPEAMLIDRHWFSCLGIYLEEESMQAAALSADDTTVCHNRCTICRQRSSHVRYTLECACSELTYFFYTIDMYNVWQMCIQRTNSHKKNAHTAS